ncbi:MAG: NAD(P)-dependent oxidoreductase, partial [Thermosphaera sp.]
CVSLEEVLRRSDVVSIHVPLLPETKYLINEERLKLMKKTAILINTSRGAVIDTKALVKALREGWIAGAGLDVFEEEPLPKDHPLLSLDNVVLTPHIGASTREAQEKAGIEVARKIIEYFKK